MILWQVMDPRSPQYSYQAVDAMNDQGWMHISQTL